jgi:hypothetical protein
MVPEQSFFGILFYLFLVNWCRARQERSSLPVLAAALAMLWNVGSLIGLATGLSSRMGELSIFLAAKRR